MSTHKKTVDRKLVTKLRIADIPVSERERENSNSKMLLHKDCSSRSVKNLSNN